MTGSVQSGDRWDASVGRWDGRGTPKNALTSVGRWDACTTGVRLWDTPAEWRKCLFFKDYSV